MRLVRLRGAGDRLSWPRLAAVLRAYLTRAGLSWPRLAALPCAWLTCRLRRT
ncbi:hypothetical protein OG809_26890 [Kribbella soli]